VGVFLGNKAEGWMKDFGYIYCNYWSQIQLASTVIAPAWGRMMIRWLGELLYGGWTYAHWNLFLNNFIKLFNFLWWELHMLG
jgi:hypothetical protein